MSHCASISEVNSFSSSSLSNAVGKKSSSPVIVNNHYSNGDVESGQINNNMVSQYFLSNSPQSQPKNGYSSINGNSNPDGGIVKDPNTFNGARSNSPLLSARECSATVVAPGNQSSAAANNNDYSDYNCRTKSRSSSQDQTDDLQRDTPAASMRRGSSDTPYHWEARNSAPNHTNLNNYGSSPHLRRSTRNLDDLNAENGPRGGDDNNGSKTDEEKLDAFSLNGGVIIEVPNSHDVDDTDFPPEKKKTVIAFFILLFSFFFTTISLAVVHDRVPDRKDYGPLPDTFLDLVPARDWALSVSEVFIMITSHITLIIVIFHKHRYIIFRRMFLMLSLLYFFRSVTMFVTVLPVSSNSYECSKKEEHPTVGLILLRALQLFSGLGLTINGRHTYCGDYIYSGHTTILVMSCLMICEYSPRRFQLLHWAVGIMSFMGVIMVLVSHGHYTVDVIIAYYITTRLFWLYHTLANNQFLKTKSPTNYLAREWWFCFFRYFEGNVRGPVPLEYNFPIQWPFAWPGRSYRCN